MWGSSQKTDSTQRRNFLKQGGLGQFADLGWGGGLLARKRGAGGGVFEWGVNTPMHTMYNMVLKLHSDQSKTQKTCDMAVIETNQSVSMKKV